LDLSLSSDKGGWQFYNKFAVPTSPVDAGNPNRLLDFYLSPQTTDEKLAERNWNQHAHSKHHFNSKFLNDEDIADEPDRSCTRQNWALEYHPTCNLLHDLNLLSQDYPSRDNRLDTFYTSHGYFRDVWVLDDEKEKSILKLSRWKHDFKPTLYVGILRDALIMERLTVSPRIVDIYGHCGTAIRVEAIPFEMENVIVPGEGYISSEEEEEEKMKPDVTSKNKFTPTEKLEIALSMAKSIADLHGFSDGLIIHDDVQLCQWLKKKDGAVVLGDFNRAEIPEFNQEKGKYCKYRNGQGFGSVS
jgi:serine/threonine protein kinase